MKVSVVVPVYNVEKYLRSCINSILNQTLQDIELILVDDGSPDGSGKICDEFAASDNRVKVVHKKNAGVGPARNDGLREATGDWIIFGDSDDWFESEALEKLVTVGEETRADVVFGDVYLVENGIKKKVQFYKDELVTNDLGIKTKLIAAVFSRAYCYNPPKSGKAFGYGGPWNKLVRRSLLVDNGLEFDISVKGIFDDLIYTAYIFAYANRISYKHILVYDYRHVVSSITRTYKPMFPEINRAIFMAWENYMKQFHYEQELLQPYYANVIRRFYQLLGLYFFNQKNTTPFLKQLRELKKVMKEEPYASAIRKAEKSGFHSKADGIICKAAKTGLPFVVYCAYKVVQLIRG